MQEANESINLSSRAAEQNAGYDSLARKFGADFRAARYHSAASFQQRRRVLSRLVGAVNPQLILDAGCGTGNYCEGQAGAGVRVGLDRSFEALKAAGSQKIIPVQGDLEALPFKNNVFDTVLALEILQHFHKPDKVLAYLVSAVRPDGKIIISSLHPGSLLHRLYRPFGSYCDLFFHPHRSIQKSLECLGCSRFEITFLAYPLNLSWRHTEARAWASFLGTSWILSATKNSN